MSVNRILIIDGYVDEPTCLGVPPFVSTYVRYAAGAVGLSGDEFIYKTIEQVRQSNLIIRDQTDLAVLITGNPVPGKYLGGEPVRKDEIKTLLQLNSIPLWVGGPVQFDREIRSLQELFGHFKVVEKDIEAYLYDYLNGKDRGFRHYSVEEWNAFAENGALLMNEHPRFPDVIAEIETSRGCLRKTHCSFCIEGSYSYRFRDSGSIVWEMKSMYERGVRYFRLSKQADLLSYASRREIWKDGFSRPEPEQIEILYREIRENLPDLQMLHLDNINPGTIVRFPEESYRILSVIAEYNTEGDIAALGMESADPEVIQQNFLKTGTEGIEFAVKMINETGNRNTAAGKDKLLPGINLLHGLIGESRKTFEMNYDFLKNIYKSGYLLRRINIRQVKIAEGTLISRKKIKSDRKIEAAFRKYRKMIRDEIDKPMLERLFPRGTVIHHVIIEAIRGDWSIGRALGTYAIVINIPRHFPLLEKMSILIVDYRERSLIGIPLPVDPEKISYHELKQIPYLKKKSAEIYSEGPKKIRGFLSNEEGLEFIRPYLLK